jgi:hypothetical protein
MRVFLASITAAVVFFWLYIMISFEVESWLTRRRESRTKKQEDRGPKSDQPAT